MITFCKFWKEALQEVSFFINECLFDRLKDETTEMFLSTERIDLLKR